jgi:serine/threonine protein kinase
MNGIGGAGVPPARPQGGRDAHPTRTLTRFAGYEIVRELGRGAMGVVFLARRPGFDRELALKTIAGARAGNPLSRERFRREAKLLARINHPGVIRVHDAGEEQGVLYYVMDVVKGESLEELVARRGPLPEREAGALLVEVARSLAAIHEAGIVHRDLKPANILLDAATRRPLIADFGLALELESDGERLTRSGASVGTPDYMSPEQVRAAKDVDARSDVHALGAILYFALTGRAPFLATSMDELVRQILLEAPARPGLFSKGVSERAEAACFHALAKERADRPETAHAFAVELERALAAPPPSRWCPERVFAAMLVLLLAGGALAAHRWLGVGDEEPALKAERAELAALGSANASRGEAALVEGRRALIENDIGRAIEAVDVARVRLPEDPRAYAILARALTPARLEAGEVDPARVVRARGLLEHALALAPRDPGVALARAHFLLHDRALPEAQTILREVLAHGTALDRLDAAAIWVDRIGRTDQPELAPAVASAVTELPTWSTAHYVHGLVLDSIDRFSEARAALERCLNLEPKHAEGRLLHARVVDSLHDLEAVRADYALLLADHPDRPELMFSLGFAEERLGNGEEALHLYDRAMELWPEGNTNPVYGRRGLLLYERGEPGDLERARDDLEQGVLVVAAPRLFEVLADCDLKLGDDERARDAYERLLAVEPGVKNVLALGKLEERIMPPARLVAFYREQLVRLPAADRPAVEAEIQAAELRQKQEKLLSEKQRLNLVDARMKELNLRLASIKAELDATSALPDGDEKKRRTAAVHKRLDETNAYIKETKLLMNKP